MKYSLFAALLISAAAHADYPHVVFYPLTDKVHCAPPVKDNDGRTLRYYAPDEDVPGVPAKELGHEVELFVDHAYFQFFLSSDPVPKPESMCVGFYDDSAAPNAFAFGPKHLVLGRTMVRAFMSEQSLRARVESYVKRTDQSPAILAGFDLKPAAALSLIVAHEFAHNLQNQYGLRFEGPTVRTLELHADCTAAFLLTFFTGAENISNSDLRKTSQFIALALGDHHFDNQQHHGTPAERLRAVQTGMKQATSALIDGWDDFDVKSATALAICSQVYPPITGPMKIPPAKNFAFKDVENFPTDLKPVPRRPAPPEAVPQLKPLGLRDAGIVLRQVPVSLKPVPNAPPSLPVIKLTPPGELFPPAPPPVLKKPSEMFKVK